ncbi:MAG: oligoendopeptidase F family protein, partial [Clostridia bacterium]|nr:oligoendopeptidase F family protein [Clostridia bacterium]
DKLDVYDLYCPMVADVDWPMPYEEAKRLVLEAVKPLGEAYQAVIARAYRENWIDVYETPGKESGAFSAGVYGVHPFVKLNYAGTLDDAFTLAHELGHAMHSYLSSEAQDFANHGYKLLVAEVASTVNEVLLTKYLLSVETDPKRRAYVLNHFLEGFRTTVFRQTLFAEFEYRAHEAEAAGIPLTADWLSGLYEDLEKTYYPNAAIREEIRYEWAYIPHFYRAFYVYVYATGFCSAVYLASRIFETGDAENYLKFLSTGGSDYPINELKIAGVDLTSPEVVAGAMKEFGKTIDELAKLFD